MKLTIGIIFCDNDYTNVEKIISNIENNIKIDYEIISIDNRDKYKNKTLSFEPTFSFGENKKQFVARKKIIDLSSGDYIWFIDGDDDVINVDKLDIKDDIYIFGYRDVVSEKIYENAEYKENIQDYSKYFFSSALWNKIIKKDLFNGIENYIKDIKACAMEDLIYYIYALKNCSSVYVSSEMFYIKNEGFSDSLNITDIKIIEEITLGYNDTFEILSDILDNEDQIVEFEKMECRFFMEKLLFMNSNIKLMKKAIDIIVPLFGYDMMKDVFCESIESKFSCQSEYKTIKEYLESKYDNLSFTRVYMAKEVFYNVETGKMEEREKEITCEVLYERD